MQKTLPEPCARLLAACAPDLVEKQEHPSMLLFVDILNSWTDVNYQQPQGLPIGHPLANCSFQMDTPRRGLPELTLLERPNRSTF